MLERFRQSLALRLAILYALVFALASASLFSVLYIWLASSLETRERAALEQRTADFAAAYQFGGTAALRVSHDSAPDGRSVFVRILDSNNEQLFVAWPADWIETQVQQLLPPNSLGLSVTRQIPTVRIPQNAQRDYTIASRPLDGGFVLQVGALTDSRAVLLAPLRRAFGFVGAGSLLLSVGLGTVLAWRATRPLREVSDTARRIVDTGDLSARVPAPKGRGELAVLVRQLNTLLDKNTTHVRILRETLDNLAHDLRTPITRLRGTAELALQDGVDPAEARSALADCVNETDRLLHVIETLLDISAAEGGALKLNRDRIDLRTVVERAADLYREVAEEKKIDVVLDLPETVEAEVDAIRLGQAMNNLVDNALKYTPAGGRVMLSAASNSDSAVIKVSDNGPGVPLAEREAIFRRLYRGDASRSQRGLGLGLSLVKAIVESHQGTISVGDSPEGGACFTVRLPKIPALSAH